MKRDRCWRGKCESNWKQTNTFTPLPPLPSRNLEARGAGWGARWVKCFQDKTWRVQQVMAWMGSDGDAGSCTRTHNSSQYYLHAHKDTPPPAKKMALLLVLPTQKIKYNSQYKCVCLNINEYHLWKLLMHPGRWSAHTYLMCLIPAILIPDAQFGMMIKECFTAGGLSPCQHSVVEWRQPPSVLVVRRCSQRQQSLHKRTAQT